MILPHYQDTKNQILDGKRLFEEITYPDSLGKTFYALLDGSYLYSADGEEKICGKAYQIKDGKCIKICSKGEEMREAEKEQSKKIEPKASTSFLN